ncbi:MAG: GTPase Era [Acetothermia bacterium 64_32]|nr:MAG: GTPase Era [Acetothermia bacterium 64_32]MBC7097591.1 GTPase Era [Candidatus Bipolaricaulota bacterium]HAF70718.1 GTPase Era [Candidatus Acetothermia bacterium]
MAYKAGIVAVVGKTNVGKSTFINAVMGQKVVIVSDRPQTTRNRIRCIYTTDEAQVVFVDTPGLHRPVNKLSAHILREAFRALAGVDELLYMTEPTGGVDPYDQEVLPRIRTLPCPKLLLVNKIDQAKGNQLPETLLAYEKLGIFDELVPISCIKGKNLDRALELIVRYLPEGEPLFPDGVAVDRPFEFIVAELIREKIFHLTYQEIPYSTAVVVDRVHERDDRSLIEIYATIYVAKDSQKAIVIGKGGQKLKEIGRLSRLELEALLGKKVFLSLHVKVKPRWTEDELEIARLTGD